MPDLRKIIGETKLAPYGFSVADRLEEGCGRAFADRMISAIADRVVAALTSDEAVEAATKTLHDRNDGDRWEDYTLDARAALQAAAKAIRGERQ